MRIGRKMLGIALLVVSAQPGCYEAKDERQRHKDDKRLDRFYEKAWIECVNELGIERCRLIQETGFRQCRGYSYNSKSGIVPCAEERFDERLETLPEPSTRGAPDIQKPEQPLEASANEESR